MRVSDNCNHRQGAYETVAQFVGECGRYTLRGEIWVKPYLYPDDYAVC